MASTTLNSKVGVGELGVIRQVAVATWPPELLQKTCMFCKRLASDPDPLDDTLTLSWHKPKISGKVCAYCGTTKARLYPGRDNQHVARELTFSQEKNKHFYDFRGFLIEQYLAGNKAARGRYTPKQTVDRTQEFNVRAIDKGQAMLLQAYVKAHGDPASNGKNHRVSRMQWKDLGWGGCVAASHGAGASACPARRGKCARAVGLRRRG